MSSLKIAASLAGIASMSLICLPAAAQENSSEPAKSEIEDAIAKIKPIFQARLRYETVEQDNALSDADALTYRFRVGFQTGEAYDTSFLIEFDHVEDIIDDFNPDPFTPNANSGVFSVVPDPNVTELNRLQLVNKSIPDTIVTLGRQRIILDDSRFVGNVGWRQNEQTFDGLRVQNTALGSLSVDVSYINRINRIFGDDSNVGEWEGDTYLVNVSHPTPIGKLTGFAYLIDVNNAGGIFSNQTLGARLTGKQKLGSGNLGYTFSYASQDDYGSSNLDYSADFINVEGVYKAEGFLAGAGYEMLGGDTQRGFQAPLSTLHKFNGWADVFLNTPTTGIEDLYVKAGGSPGDLGIFKKTNFTAIYHDYSSDTGGLDYGSEFNLVATAKIGKVKSLIKFADYSADSFAVDTQKVWFQFDYAF